MENQKIIIIKSIAFLLSILFFISCSSYPQALNYPSFSPRFIDTKAEKIKMVILTESEDPLFFQYDATAFTKEKTLEKETNHVDPQDYGIYSQKSIESFKIPNLNQSKILPFSHNLIVGFQFQSNQAKGFFAITKSFPFPVFTLFQKHQKQFGKNKKSSSQDYSTTLQIHSPEILYLSHKTFFRVYADIVFKNKNSQEYYRVISIVNSDASSLSQPPVFSLSSLSSYPPILHGISKAEKTLHRYLF